MKSPREALKETLIKSTVTACAEILSVADFLCAARNAHIYLNMLRFLRWKNFSYGLPPLHFTRHSLRYVANRETMSDSEPEGLALCASNYPELLKL